MQTILEEGQKVNLSDAIHHSQFLWKLKADTSEHNEMTREDFFYEQVSLLLLFEFLYEMNFTHCVSLVCSGSVQKTLHNTRCTNCLHRPNVIINQQYTKGEIHFIYLHYFMCFDYCVLSIDVIDVMVTPSFDSLL